MNFLNRFLHNESSPGIVLIFVTILALLLQNSFLSGFYNSFLHTPVAIKFGSLEIAKPLILWVNDGLMAIFFFLIGLEVKREVLEGHLSSVKEVTLPLIAAIGGMAIPALVYLVFNYQNSFNIKGWAIPTATDIAFALGILSLLGSRVPSSLKIFLMALAIIDDLGAIVIIALFYTQELSTLSIAIATLSLVLLFVLNRLNVVKKLPYIILGIILWVSVLKSGVHATLAGVALAFMIPLKIKKDGKEYSPLKDMEKELHLVVAFFILPLFAFVNAGVSLKGISFADILSSVPIGIFLGLFIGKQLGVFGFSYIAVKLKLASLPKDSTLMQFYGVALLTGIGFTMSLFIDSLAFEDTNIFNYADKLAILLASFFSAIVGFIVLKFSLKNTPNPS